MKEINLETLDIEMIDGSFKETPIDKEIIKRFCNSVYNSTSDIGEKDLARMIYKNQIVELEDEDVQRFRGIMDKYGKSYFVAIAQEAILKQLNN